MIGKRLFVLLACLFVVMIGFGITLPVLPFYVERLAQAEHAPWIALMLATAVAFVSVRYRRTLLRDAPQRNMATTLLAICFALVAFVALMGTFMNKVAPLE